MAKILTDNWHLYPPPPIQAPSLFWANVINEQRQMNNLITWNFLFKNP